MDFKDYYQTLGVSRDADAKEIQKAYRKLARKFHPDLNQEEGAEDRFKEISEAYEVLKDSEKRKKYDQFGSAWKQAESTGSPPPGWEGMDFGGGGVHFEGVGDTGFSSFFEMLFGGGGFGGERGGFHFEGFGPGGRGGQGRARGWKQRGADREATLHLSLEDAAAGGQRTLTLTDPETGEQQKLKVRIPGGVLPGRRIRLRGKGGQGVGGGPPGDLYLRIEIAPDERFSLEGHDLHTRLPIAPWEAALGGEARVQTLNGAVRVKIPAGSSSGQKIRLRGKGYPKMRGGHGDLYAEIQIVVPKDLSDHERELFERLAEGSGFDPRGESG
ncbi:MAG: J domain-containing protein [Thermoanaerobaculia bacterium]|nr:J domain-containing protein [Thermoanaerobaculia bacterium]